MKTEWRIFGGIAAFLLATSGVYGWWTWYSLGYIEWIGTIALLLSFFLSIMVGTYFLVIARRIDLRPEDRPEAEISEGAGEVGFFSPGSYYPMGIALAASVTGIGVAFWMWWLMVAGGIAVIVATSGMLFEYQTGSRRTAVE
ncbi:cytochrome c oxidase subunit 4 [Natronosporangium hydrolyticum]|uniref:Cytochrome c oxidase polypeptide 4 n=1 Tax=Natronosporangium hydrolyticum TaxID=2811111 RepID=A0A895YB64_9ACTN|nr:cytochrome c oxidase subunit 4 [Natronosporangium hydrolyticum]QSB13525.1 cytochrome c oxidase subunit 4 [Natronosporangium hydrolyticum]